MSRTPHRQHRVSRDMEGVLTLPTIRPDQSSPLPKAILVECVAGVDDIKQYIVEESLERWNRCALVDQKGRQRVRACNA